jgi:hypothetical protein
MADRLTAGQTLGHAFCETRHVGERSSSNLSRVPREPVMIPPGTIL